MNQQINDLIHKLNQGQCTEEEIDFLLKYLNTGDQEELKKQLSQEWQAESSVALSAARKVEIWRQIEAARESRSLTNLRRSRKRKISRFLKIAAVFAGLAIVSVLFLKYPTTPSEATDAITVEFGEGAVENLEDHEVSALEAEGIVLKEDKLIYPPTDTARGELVYHTIRIPHGRKFQVVLSDGSTVFLNSGSTFRYPVNFHKGKAREVFLQGEAFFTVAKRIEEEFLVQTEGLQTEVLGTEFNISSHEGDSKIEVVLVEGSIKVTGEESVTLVPDQKLTLMKKSGDIRVEEVEASEYIEWIYGIIWFKNDSFNEIIPRLERQFDVKIENNFEGLESQRFTGRFETESLEEILEVFKMVSDFDFTISGKKISIEKPEQ